MSEISLPFSPEATYVSAANCKKTLLAMAIGIRVENGDLLADVDDTSLLNRTVGLSKKTKYLPTVQILYKEITRRTDLYSTQPKFKGKKQKPILVKWLTDNAISDLAEVAFLKQHVTQFKNTLQTYQQVQEAAARDVQTGAWHGHSPFLRISIVVSCTDP